MAGLVAKATSLAGQLAIEAKPKLATFIYYAKVELVPPKPNEIGQAIVGIKDLIVALKNQRWKQLTVKEGFVNSLIAAEVACWFYVGECIGKRHIVGYDV